MTVTVDEELTTDLPPDDPAPSTPSSPATLLTCLSALLATASFGWLGGSIFAGPSARAVGLAGALLGVAVVALSMRSRRPSFIQYTGAGVSVVIGAFLVLPDATGGSASLPSLVVEAVRSGGLGVPPVAFDPGWRFLLFVASALLGQATAGLALGLDRPRVASAVAVPLVVGAALLQPPGSEVSGTLIALLLLVGSLVVSLGADLAEDGTGGTGFELRRLARGAGALAVLGALLAGTAQLGFLFPEASTEQVIPPMRPQLPPPSPDRALFTVDSPRAVTWRLGTLDVYRSPAWLTPPYDSGRLVDVGKDGRVPVNPPQDSLGKLGGPTFTATFTLADTEGKTLPGLANEVAVKQGPDVLYDPRTQVLRVKGTRPRKGTTYQVVAAVPPTGKQLSEAGPPGPAQKEFLSVPPPPPEVTALLATAPVNPFARLQHVRRAYFANVIAAGAGKPVDVPPARVGELLTGKPGTPYEITAGEVLLARWAGVPARIGYGYFGGKQTGSRFEVRPRNGATWLEVHFAGHGWVPIVGTPPRAQVSLNRDPQNADPSVRASKELALVTYVPVKLTTVRLLYVLVRYYVLAALPWILAAGLLLAFFPAVLKLVRRTARARKAGGLGQRAQIAAAYAELRDTATDLGIGNPAMSPLEFYDAVAPDPEHRELAWLVTRALWGDLGRDLKDSDVRAAEAMSRSVAKRLRSAQPGFTRGAAATSRSSLSNPWTRELPSLWPTGERRFWPPRPMPVALALVPVLVAGFVLAGLRGDDQAPVSGPALPTRIVPPMLGDLRFVAEREAEKAYLNGSPQSLASEGRVFSIRQGDVVQGSLQVAGLKPEVDVRSRRVREQVLEGLGSGRFSPTRFGQERGYVLRLPEQTLYLAFARNGRSFSLMVTRAAFTRSDAVFTALLAYGRGVAPTIDNIQVPVPDPRRGSPS